MLCPSKIVSHITATSTETNYGLRSQSEKNF